MSYYEREKAIRDCIGAFYAANAGVVLSAAGPGTHGDNAEVAQFLIRTWEPALHPTRTASVWGIAFSMQFTARRDVMSR